MNFQITPMTKNDLETIKDILTIEFDDFWNYTTLLTELENPNSSYFVCKFNYSIVRFRRIMEGSRRYSYYKYRC